MQSASKDNPLFIQVNCLEDGLRFTEQFFGFSELSEFAISINGVPCQQAMLTTLRQKSLLISEPQWFCGTIYDNIALNHRHFSMNTLYHQLEKLNLFQKVMQLSHGIHTVIPNWKAVFTAIDMKKIMLLRAWIVAPEVLVVDCSLDVFSEQNDQNVFDLLDGLTNTVKIIVTQRHHLDKVTNCWVLSS